MAAKEKRSKKEANRALIASQLEEVMEIEAMEVENWSDVEEMDTQASGSQAVSPRRSHRQVHESRKLRNYQLY